MAKHKISARRSYSRRSVRHARRSTVSRGMGIVAPIAFGFVWSKFVSPLTQQYLAGPLAPLGAYADEAGLYIVSEVADRLGPGQVKALGKIGKQTALVLAGVQLANNMTGSAGVSGGIF